MEGTGGVVSRNTSVAARDGGRYWIVENLEIPGRDTTLIPSSSKSSLPPAPTTECAGLRARETVLAPLNRLAVVRDNVIDCRDVAERGELSCASSARR